MALSSQTILSAELSQFANEHQLQWLCTPTVISLKKGEFSLDKVNGFQTFKERVDQEMLNHPVIHFNDYCEWFKQGSMSMSVVKEFLSQIVVVFNLLLSVQAKKILSATSLSGKKSIDEVVACKIIDGQFLETLLKEIVKQDEGHRGLTDWNVGSLLEEFNCRIDQFRWLVKTGESLGVSFSPIDKRCQGSVSTRFLCDELARLYVNANELTETAATFAVNYWFSTDFWNQLAEGFINFKQKSNIGRLPLGFLTRRTNPELDHAQTILADLEKFYFTRDVNEDAFIIRGNEMLDGVRVFWDGLDQHRKALH